MKLMTREIKSHTPALYSTEDVPLEEKTLVAKYFHPFADWQWYLVEIDKEDNDLCFGYVDGDFPEWGYFRLSELEANNVERDIYFRPKKAKEVIS